MTGDRLPGSFAQAEDAMWADQLNVAARDQA
jgi:hypothetical protein